MIYPTAYNDDSEDAPDICDIDSEEMRESANGCYEQQAAAYEEAANVFAPYYRQMNMQVASTATEEERDELLQGVPKADLFAAYALGYSITDEFLQENPQLTFAEGADDLGVVISWNTEGPGNKDQDNFVVEEGAIAINPLNWKRDDTYAGKEECLGARVEQEDGSVERGEGRHGTK